MSVLRIFLVASMFALMSFVGSARAEWLKAETEYFIIYGDSSERTMRNYAQKVERFDTLLRTYYPIQSDYPTPKLEIFLANGRRDMLKIAPGISPSIAGFYSPNSGRIYAVVNTESTRGDFTLFHEYGHHFMFQMKANAYPSWFVEGFAEYYSTADVKPDSIQFGRHDESRMSFFVQQPVNSWAPMRDVLKWRISDSGRYRAGDYYAQAWGLTHYFLSTPERTRLLGQYLAAVAGGEESIAAMQRVTGRTPEQLQNDMRLYLMGGIALHTPQVEFPTPEVEIFRLSASERELIWLDLRLDRTPVKVETPEPVEGETDQARRRREEAIRDAAENRADLIRTALAVGTQPPDDLLRLRVVARAHRLAGDSVAAFQTLEPQLTQSQTDPDLLRLAAELLMDQTDPDTDPAEATGNRREARSYLARSLEADRLNFLTYRAINTLRQGEPGYPNANDIAVLEDANGLAPQSFDVRMRLAQAYMASNAPAKALEIARPVANNPHGGSWARRAKTIVASAQTALGQTVDPIEQTPDPAAEPETSTD